MTQELDSYLVLTYGVLDLSRSHYDRAGVTAYTQSAEEYLSRIPDPVLLSTLRDPRCSRWFGHVNQPDFERPDVLIMVRGKLVARIFILLFQSYYPSTVDQDIATLAQVLDQNLRLYHSREIAS